MRTIIRSGYFWRFAGGFALGAIGMFALQPAQATHSRWAPSATAAAPAR